jgi:hypothetical protein
MSTPGEVRRAASGGSRKRSLVTATRGTKVFLDRKRRVPVAAHAMFVGRRPELQQALRALRSGERAGVLLHGQGRLGKSSLAARVADRMPEYAVGVVFGDYGALAVLDAVAAAVSADPAARELVASRLAGVRGRPEAVGEALTDLLAGPCAQAGDGRRPLLLVIDDLEQVLVPDPGGPRKVAAGYAGVLAAVLRAFDPAYTGSRLLVTAGSSSPWAGCRTGWRRCSCGRCRRWARPSCGTASRPWPPRGSRRSGRGWPPGRWR